MRNGGKTEMKTKFIQVLTLLQMYLLVAKYLSSYIMLLIKQTDAYTELRH